jgi:hypothetical protein
MLEKIIQEIQKLINGQFKYAELIALLDKKKDFLLRQEILDKLPTEQYNAMWDTMINLEEFFKTFSNNNYVTTSEIPVNRIFQHNLKLRTK